MFNQDNRSNALANIYRTILMELGVTPTRFNYLLNSYINKLKTPTNIRDISNIRGNIKKELMKPAMTWKVFIKGLIFLNVKSFKITLELNHANGKTTIHSKSILLDDIQDTEEDTLYDP